MSVEPAGPENTLHAYRHSRLALVDKSNADPSLAALLRIYKNYYPEIALGHQARGPAAIYKVRFSDLVAPGEMNQLTGMQHPNREWRSRLDEIQQNYRATRNHAPDAARNGFAVKKSLVFRGKNRIPEVQTLEAKKVSRVVKRPCLSFSVVACSHLPRLKGLDHSRRCQ